MQTDNSIDDTTPPPTNVGDEDMAKTPKLASVLDQDRKRLNSEKDALRAQRDEIDEQIAVIDRELKAIDTYEAIKSGKMPVARSSPRRGGKREAILGIIKKAGARGVSRGEILDELGLKGDTAGETSVSNALGALKKVGSTVSRDGRYYTS